MSKIKLTKSELLTIILVVTIALVLVFGWWYLKGSSPLETLPSFTQSEIPQPEYLFTIFDGSGQTLNNPMFTTVDQNKIYVADSQNRRIIVYNYNGKFLYQFGSTGKGQLKFPVCIIFAKEHIYVPDAGTRKIHVFDLQGQFIGFFGEKTVRLPISMFYKNQRFYLIDAAFPKVLVLNDTGSELFSFGRGGSGAGEFYFPFSIYVNQSNQILVADSNNNRIQVFSENGKFLRFLSGADPKGSGTYSIPRGLAFDRKGNLYTTELMNSCVAITNQAGRIISRFSYTAPEDTSGLEAIKYPTSVFIDANQRLYVSEYGNSRVLVYKIK